MRAISLSVYQYLRLGVLTLLAYNGADLTDTTVEHDASQAPSIHFFGVRNLLRFTDYSIIPTQIPADWCEYSKRNIRAHLNVYLHPPWFLSPVISILYRTSFGNFKSTRYLTNSTGIALATFQSWLNSMNGKYWCRPKTNSNIDRLLVIMNKNIKKRYEYILCSCANVNFKICQVNISHFQRLLVK